MTHFFHLVPLILIPVLCLTALSPIGMGSESYLEDWFDSARDRTVPVRIFLPERNKGEIFPVVLLSHGLGGSREGFGYLGDSWSKSGYIVVVMQHSGSDSAVWFERNRGETPIQAAARAITPQNAHDRYDDVRFVLDELQHRHQCNNEDEKEKLAGHIDLERIGIAGHSFGSFTVFATIGRAPFSPEPRIKAAIAMSPNTPRGLNPKFAHRNIKIPILHLTGTQDTSPIDKTFQPNERRIPFDSIQNTEEYLVIWNDANHMVFSGHPRPLGITATEKTLQPHIAEITLHFLNAYLRDNSEERQWLRNDGLRRFVGNTGTVELK